MERMKLGTTMKAVPLNYARGERYIFVHHPLIPGESPAHSGTLPELLRVIATTWSKIPHVVDYVQDERNQISKIVVRRPDSTEILHTFICYNGLDIPSLPEHL